MGVMGGDEGEVGGGGVGLRWVLRGRAGGSERCPVRSRVPRGAARREGSAVRG